jgi:hypothetical protein
MAPKMSREQYGSLLVSFPGATIALDHSTHTGYA